MENLWCMGEQKKKAATGRRTYGNSWENRLGPVHGTLVIQEGSLGEQDRSLDIRSGDARPLS